MNGLVFFLLIALQGQVSSPASEGQTKLSREYGWQVDSQGTLVYIVQVSPQEAAHMQQNDLEKPSDMPPDLVGRVSRIVVRIGEDELPQTPGIQEVIRRFPRHGLPSEVSSALGPGNFSTVEPGSIVTVQNQAGPPLPFRTQRESLSDLGTQENLVDRASEVARSEQSNSIGSSSRQNLGQQFLSGAGNTQIPTRIPSLPGGESSNSPASTSKFQNTAPGGASSAFPLPGTTGQAQGLPGSSGLPTSQPQQSTLPDLPGSANWPTAIAVRIVQAMPIRTRPI